MTETDEIVRLRVHISEAAAQDLDAMAARREASRAAPNSCGASYWILFDDSRQERSAPVQRASVRR